LFLLSEKFLDRKSRPRVPIHAYGDRLIYAWEVGMSQPILSESTIAACTECVFIADNMHGFLLAEALQDAGVSPESLSDPFRARMAFDGLLKAVDWANPTSISVIIPVFAAAYAESPKSMSSIHARIDVAMARDGFRFNDRQLLRLTVQVSYE
ncbi:MAG TPA: hypothetical protein VE954_25715, partial [Oligoflexus sp.]|uniref:hypothetical protein n=1 Tax=Oligoflexus sp. TaxID=1971216 RepID=UPI002D5ED86F